MGGYDGSITVKTELDTSDFDSQIKLVEQQMEEIEYKIKQADMGFEVGDTLKLEAQYEKLTGKLVKLQGQQKKVANQQFDNVKKSIDSVGDSVNKTIKKVGKWALAVFGIRSAYLAVRSAMSTLTQYNDQIKADLEYIRYVTANALAPIIEWLIQLAYKLLTYVGLIAKAWFGVDIFAKSSANAFKNANKEAQKLKNTTAGFDELNILSTSTSTGAEQGGVPSFDLSAPEEIPIPSWLQWLLDNGETVVGVLFGMAEAVLLLKAGMGGIKAIGFGLIIAGIYIAVQNLMKFLNDPTWENFAGVLDGISLILIGLALVTGNWWLALAGGIAIAVSLIIKNWDKIKEGFGKVVDWISDKWQKFTSWLKGDNLLANAVRVVLNGVIGLFNTFITALNAMLLPVRGLIVAFGAVTGKGWDFEDVQIPKINYLATGGIVNLPNTGVPVGNARAGEAGMEGVIPLTDSQAMETLGETIGRYITINATMINKINGRTLNKETQRIKAENEFVLNR